MSNRQCFQACAVIVLCAVYGMMTQHFGVWFALVGFPVGQICYVILKSLAGVPADD